MKVEEYLKETREMNNKAIDAFLSAPDPFDYKDNFMMNPWYQRKNMFLRASLFYLEMAQTLEAIKEL